MDQVTIRDTGDLKAVAKALRKHADGKALRLELSRGIRAELKPLVPVLRAAYLAGPSGGTRKSRSRAAHAGLRVLLAKSARVEVKLTGKQAGARVRADGRRLPDGMKGLARMYEGNRPWRHPLFGNRDEWVAQPSHPTFYRVVTPYASRVERAIQQIAEQVVQKIAKE